MHKVIVDSSMTLEQALRNLSPECPEPIRAAQRLIDVQYYSSDGHLHAGQIVVHKALESDVRELFAFIKETRFPIHSAIPISHPDFLKDGAWSDDLSMAKNNSSGFNFRQIAGQSRLSLHALGLAFDLNPAFNPCYQQVPVRGEDGNEYHSHYAPESVAPPEARYDITRPGTLTERHPVTEFLVSRGYVWGGRWQFPFDPHHFQRTIGLGEEVDSLIATYRP